jgi:hypothetical protein
MSGLETVKIIVDAEREASRILSEAQTKASETRKQIDIMIEAEREKRLSIARGEAALVVQRAEAEGRSEALFYEEEEKRRIKQELQKASANRAAAVNALFDILMG